MIVQAVYEVGIRWAAVITDNEVARYRAVKRGLLQQQRGPAQHPRHAGVGIGGAPLEVIRATAD